MVFDWGNKKLVKQQEYLNNVFQQNVCQLLTLFKAPLLSK